MRIQVIENNNKYYDVINLNSLKEICDKWVSEYGSEKLDWLHSEIIDYSCDALIYPVSSTEVKVGFLYDECKASNTNNTIHWVSIRVLDTTMLDALTQILLVTICMHCIQSVTGSFCVDWTDVRTVLSRGSMAYCALIDWSSPHQVIEQFRVAKSQLNQAVDIVGCTMLLNQGLRVKDTYENVQSLMTANVVSSDCLTITNLTNTNNIPQINVLMFVCNIEN